MARAVEVLRKEKQKCQIERQLTVGRVPEPGRQRAAGTAQNQVQHVQTGEREYERGEIGRIQAMQAPLPERSEAHGGCVILPSRPRHVNAKPEMTRKR